MSTNRGSPKIGHGTIMDSNPASEPSGHALGWKTLSTTKATIRAEASQGEMPTRALTGARADTCTSSGSPEIGN
eukprot:7377854-Lingulodinium_polyedra.AAC.1